MGALWEYVSKIKVFNFPYRIKPSHSGWEGEEKEKEEEEKGGCALPMRDSHYVFPQQGFPLDLGLTRDVGLDGPEDSSPPAVLHPNPTTFVPLIEDSLPEVWLAP